MPDTMPDTMTNTMPAATSATAAVPSTDRFPSGSWGLGPLLVRWDIKGLNEIHVHVSVLGIDVDELVGTITGDDTKLADDVNVLGLIRGNLTFEARFHQGPAADGLWLSGNLTGLGTIAPVRVATW